MNIWDIVIIAAVALIIGLGIRNIVRKKGNTCSCGCADCPSCTSCHKEKQ